MRRILIFIAGLAVAFSCNGGGGAGGNNVPEPPVAEEPGFAKGADISWVTEMEANGHKFRDAAGNETDCFQLMKDLGLDAVRLRVWVDPSAHGNWCNTADMVAKAKRAAALDMDVMVDFHYSDWWADPHQQHKPASWKKLGLEDLKKAIYSHTSDVMEALKAEGVTPKWVQVGNEIRPGMLWDEDASLSGASYDIRECDVKDSGSTSTEVKYRANLVNLAAFINEGYNAVKSVFPETIVIVHLDNGYDGNLYNWFFDELKKNGGKWDMIGMSLYPYWSKDVGDAELIISRGIANMKAVALRYDCDVMLVETGVECADDMGNLASDSVLQAGYEQLSRIVKESREKTDGRCRGVFYWEPECRPGQYRLGAFTEDGRPTIIMDAFKD